MKKKVSSFLLGVTLLVIGGFGMFTAFEASAEDTYNKHLNYIDEWCDHAGDNCSITVVLPVPNDL